MIHLLMVHGIQVEDTCLVALATAYNARETEGGTTKQQLLHFVEEVSFMCSHTHTRTHTKESFVVRVGHNGRPHMYFPFTCV